MRRRLLSFFHAQRASQPGVCPALGFLFAAALLLARGSAPPAQAGMFWEPHVHQWTEGGSPIYRFGVSHIGGQPITDDDPALPCEIIQIWEVATGMTESDICVAPGCPHPLGIYHELCTPLKWRDSGAPGHFVHGPSHPSRNNEFTEEGVTYGRGGAAPIYYRVSRHQGADAVTLEPFADDSHPNNDPRAYDDPPDWEPSVTFPVGGTRCKVQNGADESSNSRPDSHP
jgi:hypothetical protein